MSDYSEEKVEGLIDNIFSVLEKFHYINAKDIPSIGLYMDQVTTFMDRHMVSISERAGDKALTKTMINNYTKNKLLPPSDKKRYSREHLMILIYIYYMKNFLPISDVQAILQPLEEHYFNSSGPISLSDIYDEVLSVEFGELEHVKEDVKRIYASTTTSFEDVPESDREFLTTFSFICALSLDIYIKKMIIQDLVDQLIIPEAAKERAAEKEAKARQKAAAKARRKSEKEKAD